MTTVMFDSNVFDKIADGSLPYDIIEKSTKLDYKYFITHLQSDEISNCPNTGKRQVLVLFLLKVKPEIIETTVTIVGVARVGFCRIGDGNIYSKLLNNNKTNVNDAIIGETAIQEGHLLVTDDKQLRKKIINLGGKSLRVSDFRKELENAL